MPTRGEFENTPCSHTTQPAVAAVFSVPRRSLCSFLSNEHQDRYPVTDSDRFLHRPMRLPSLAIAICFVFLCVVSAKLHAADYRVLVVMSYEENNPWSKEIRAGIDAVLSNTSDITYFYMDTKVNFEGGTQKAKEAFSLFEELRPDGVITADDNAQHMFVLPYLSNRTDTPIMFCGVNADAGEYGYPNAHVSGILERGHIRESIAFSKQLIPSIENVVFIARKSPSGIALSQQVEKESASFPARKVDVYLIDSIAEILSLSAGTMDQYDAIYTDSLEGVKDSEGKALSNRAVVEQLASTFRKPIIGANQYHVEQGALCAVVKTGQEQGATAAEMLLKAMQGMPVSELPVTQNFRGKRVINVTAMKQTGIDVRPIVLLGATLIKTGE